MSTIGVVAIGRNEGERLVRCLESVQRAGCPGVYVDSGSNDGSVQHARAQGFSVVELDMSVGFTAARARHEGLLALQSAHPELDMVMFVDGDCEIVDGWISAACRFLEDRADVAVVCGRRRERYPKASIYNQLCDIEWQTPIGEAQSSGGDFIIRTHAYEQAGGFNPTVVAGEEPELCHRIRAAGHKIWRLDEEMTIHDAAMTKFREWWRRHVRTGYAGYDVERRFSIGVFSGILRSSVVWAAVFPLLALSLICTLYLSMGWHWGMAAVGFFVVVLLLQCFRIVNRYRSVNRLPWPGAIGCGLLTFGSKWPVLWGVITIWREIATGQTPKLIEYK